MRVYVTFHADGRTGEVSDVKAWERMIEAKAYVEHPSRHLCGWEWYSVEVIPASHQSEEIL